MTAPAAKGMSVSASVALRNQPEKRRRRAARPRGWAGRMTTDKPQPWTCPPRKCQTFIILQKQALLPPVACFALPEDFRVVPLQLSDKEIGEYAYVLKPMRIGLWLK